MRQDKVVTMGVRESSAGSRFDHLTNIHPYCVCTKRIIKLTVNAAERFWMTDGLFHEDYREDEGEFENDIALVRLKTPFKFNKVVKRTNLPPSTFSIKKDGSVKGYVVGWGALELDGSYSNIMREVAVPLLTTKTCRELLFHLDSDITDDMLCAGYIKGGKDACSGDTGGPLYIYDDAHKIIQIGIVSFGYGCAESNAPGVYVNIAKYLRWIEAQKKVGNINNDNGFELPRLEPSNLLPSRQE